MSNSMSHSIKYQLADLIFCPSTKTVEKTDGSVEKLKPQLAKILMLFIENKAELVTFELLHEKVWKSRLDGNKTIQAALTKLRKELGWQVGQNLITERNEGYRLTCEVIVIDGLADIQDIQVVTPPKVLDNRVKKDVIPKFVYAAAIAVVTLAFITIHYTFFTSNQPESVREFTTKPITYIKGQELNPSISPNQKYLAFTYAKNKTLQYQVKVKLLSNNKFLAVDDAPFSSTPSWSADGATLYYQAFENEECLVKQVHLIEEMRFSKPDVITSCGKEKSESPVAVDNNNEWLYFSYKAALNKAMQVKRIHLVTAKEQQLTSPTEDAYGDYSLSLSPDGKTLAILTFDASAIGRVYLMDLHNKERVVAFNYKHLLYNVAWAKDGKSFFYIDQDAFIVQFNLSDKANTKVTQLSQPSQTIQVIKEDEFLVGFGKFYISDLFKTTLANQKPIKLQEGYFNDHSIMPISTSPEQYAFVSNRTGLEQIWLFNNGSLKQLTHYQKEVWIKELSLSADLSSIVYLTNAKLNVIDLNPQEQNQQGYAEVLTKDALFRSPIWHCNNNTIIATTKVNDVWSLAEITPLTGTVEILLKGVTGIKADCEKEKYYVTQEEKLGISQLSDLHSDTQQTIYLADYYLGSGTQWLVKNDIAYFVHQRIFYSSDLSRNNKPVQHMDNINLKTFGLLGAKVYFSEKVLNDSYIAQISVKGSKMQ